MRVGRTKSSDGEEKEDSPKKIDMRVPMCALKLLGGLGRYHGRAGPLLWESWIATMGELDRYRTLASTLYPTKKMMCVIFRYTLNEIDRWIVGAPRKLAAVGRFSM
jgi:hypothetical protein